MVDAMPGSLANTRHALTGAGILSIVAAASAASAATDLISDGMFTEGASAGLSEIIPVGDAFGPWVATWSSLDRDVVLVGELWAGTPPGGYSVDLATAAFGEVYNAPAAGVYALSFWVSGNQFGGSTTKYYSVSVSNPGNFFNNLSTTNSAREGQWTDIMEDVELSAGGGGLFFDNEDPPSVPYGAVIGDVSLTYIGPPAPGAPEPSTWALMLLGFAAIGLAGCRGATAGRAA